MALLNKPFPEAVPTAMGWAHPLTGEQLTAGALTAGQLNGETAVAYYKKNAGRKSFLNPAAATENLIQYVKRGRRVDFAVHSRHKIASVAWTFGNSQSATGGAEITCKYTAGGTFAPQAVVTFDATQQRVNTVSIGAGGTGYTSATVTFSAPQTPGGERATGTVTMSAGAVTGVTLVNRGSGYTSAPTVTITGNGTGATATATIQAVPNATLNIASLVVA